MMIALLKTMLMKIVPILTIPVKRLLEILTSKVFNFINYNNLKIKKAKH